MVEMLLECPQKSSKYQNKQKKIFLKSSHVSKVIKLSFSITSEYNHVKTQVLKWVPPEHKQSKRCGLLPFPSDQTKYKESSWEIAVTIVKQVTSLLTITDYLELKNTLSTLPSGSMDRVINPLHCSTTSPCPRQAQMPRQEQMLNLVPRAAQRKVCTLQVYQSETSGASRTHGSYVSVYSALAPSLPQLLQARTDPLPAG